jgi:2-polyprenyl-3-methyl-5-hydroxy-6-metoxy-1,4-benzoquinol methylase
MDTSIDNANAIVEHFDRLSISGDWSRLYSVSDGNSYHFQVRRARVLELLPEKLGHVLDVGMGPGVIVEQVLKRGGTFNGVDLSPAMVREAREKYGQLEGVSFREGNVEAIDAADNSYDQVLAIAVIEYLKTPDRALAEIARVLKPGGVAIVTVPKRSHIDRLTIGATAPFRALARAIAGSGTDNLPRLRLQPSELDAAAQRAGLILEGGAQYHFTPLPYPLPRFAPSLMMRLNAPFERLAATRAALPSFLAHGYVGSYRKRAD